MAWLFVCTPGLSARGAARRRVWGRVRIVCAGAPARGVPGGVLGWGLPHPGAAPGIKAGPRPRCAGAPQPGRPSLEFCARSAVVGIVRGRCGASEGYSAFFSHLRRTLTPLPRRAPAARILPVWPASVGEVRIEGGNVSFRLGWDTHQGLSSDHNFGKRRSDG